MKLLFLQHVEYEGPALIGEWARMQGHDITVLDARTLPSALSDSRAFDALTVLGGPIGVYEEGRYPWLAAEKAFIRQAINSGKKVLGICLGAQLIASALGARVYPHAQREIGWFPITLSREGAAHPAFMGLPQQMEVFHWHGDTFDLPESTELLASSAITPHQAFAWKNNVLGLQFHLEVTGRDIAAWVDACGTPKEGGCVQTTREMLEKTESFTFIANILPAFLDRFFLKTSLQKRDSALCETQPFPSL